MHDRTSVKAAYDLVAQDYAARFWDEPQHKQMDRIMLDWFATQVPAGTSVLEIGAGPGEVSGYLATRRLRCLGTDGSPRMIECARHRFPDVEFRVEDFFQLSCDDETFWGVVAFYAIVNYPVAKVEAIFREVLRVLEPKGLFLFTFHVLQGEPQVNTRSLLDKDVGELTFYFFEPDEIKELAERAGFRVTDIVVRHPYPDVEFPSKRAYFVLRKPNERHGD